MNTAERIQKEKEQGELFVKGGGDIRLFWAGRMAVAAQYVVNSNAFQVSNSICWLDAVLKEYDEIIMNEMSEIDAIDRVKRNRKELEIYQTEEIRKWLKNEGYVFEQYDMWQKEDGVGMNTPAVLYLFQNSKN